MPGVLEKIRYVRRNPFADVTGHAPPLSGVLPDKRYVVYFTPRSGSSRLTDLVTRAGGLSHPDECFNPDIVPELAQKLAATSLPEYVNRLQHARAVHGVFGCEVTYLQILLLFRSCARFVQMVQPTAVVWLIREDLVSQAISATRMVQTGVSQSVFSNPQEMTQAEEDFAYDSRAIRSAMLRLYFQESRIESHLKRSGQAPLRLSYEMINETAPKDILHLIRSHVGAASGDDGKVVSVHKKISGAKSTEMAARFRAENPRLTAWIATRRANRIGRLATTRAQLAAATVA